MGQIKFPAVCKKKQKCKKNKNFDNDTCFQISNLESLCQGQIFLQVLNKKNGLTT